MTSISNNHWRPYESPKWEDRYHGKSLYRVTSTDLLGGDARKETWEFGSGAIFTVLRKGEKATFFREGVKVHCVLDKQGRPYLSSAPPSTERHYLQADDGPRWILSPRGEKHLNESRWTLRGKGAMIFLSNLTLLPLILCALAELWARGTSNETYFSEKFRLWTVLPHLALFWVFAVFALYAVFSPYEGRAAYARLEAKLHGTGFLAPCFQPDADRHLGGGNIATRNAH